MSGQPHPAVTAILDHFTFDHLPAELQAVSAPFCQLAHSVATGGTSGPETTTALRKLLEAKDCAVRAARTERVGGFGRFENADYPGQPGARADKVEQQRQEQLR